MQAPAFRPRGRPLGLAGLCLALVCVGAAAAGERASGDAGPAPETVTVELDHALATFRPDQALGAGVDGQDQGDIAAIYTRANLRAMRSAGLRPLTYRLRTELGVEAWHWNPRGSFSDRAHQQGYWTSSTSGPPIRVSYGYRLPRRGDTIDQANDTGYSRLDDGDPRTFWKSNPYLDPHFTHEPESAHPQWVLIDLYGYPRVNAMRIDWGAPYATRFKVQRFIGPSAIALAGHPAGHWQDFPSGVMRGRGGSQTMRLAAVPQAVRFVRVLLLNSSHTAARGSRDVRDRLGYAIRELQLGVVSGAGRLRDLIRHVASGRQTITMTSSTDPWHRAADLDPHTEQPGFDRVVASGLTNGLPMLTPVAVLYGTPADAVAEARYLIARHIPVRRMELGEEPDGQLANPEDYAALYGQYARALHAVAPRLSLGGPGFQTSIPDWLAWPDAHGNRSWTNRFLAALAARGDSAQLGFFSFEWYPFDHICGPTAPQIQSNSATLAAVIARQRRHGLPAGLPLLITEYGYSAFAGQPEVDRAGGLLNADTVARMLTEGGSTAYLYGYEPGFLMRELSCPTYGNLALLQSDANRRITHPLATYWATRMLTQDWTMPGDSLHTLFGATVAAGAAGAAAPRVAAYPLRRPDGTLAVLLLNEDPKRAAAVVLRTAQAGLSSAPSGPLDVFSFSAAQYVWHPHGENGYPRPDHAPAHTTAAAGSAVTLPPYSLTVVRQLPDSRQSKP